MHSVKWNLSIFLVEIEIWKSKKNILYDVCSYIKIAHIEIDIFDYKWVDTVKSTLDHTGLSSIWEAHESNTAKFIACFSQRCKDIFQQQWHEEV